MYYQIKKLLLYSFLIFGVLPGCDKKVNKLVDTNPVTPPTEVVPVVPPVIKPGDVDILTPGPCVADFNQTIDCYIIRDIVFHGKDDGSVVWSSQTDLTTISQNSLITNKRFNVQIIPRRQYKGYDSRGVACLYQPRPYTKLQVAVKVRSTDNTYSSRYYHLFDNVSIDKESAIYEFTPAPTSSQQVIDILNVKWDWSCISYAQQGYVNVPGYCPWDSVWKTECVSLDIRFATDDTKNLAGPRE